MAKASGKTRPCPRCQSANPSDSVQCFSCGYSFPLNAPPPSGLAKRLVRASAKALAFVSVLAVFGFGFWAASGDNVRILRDRFGAGAPPAEEAPPPPVAPPPAPPTVVLIGPAGTTRVQSGHTATIAMGHAGHRLHLTASAENGRVTLQTRRDGRLTVLDGETVSLQCDQKRLQRTTEGGRLSIKQVACPDSLAVRVMIE